MVKALTLAPPIEGLSFSALKSQDLNKNPVNAASPLHPLIRPCLSPAADGKYSGNNCA